MPLISIIIDNYNYGRYLEKAIKSVLTQQYASYELIVIDDGSTDHSAEVMFQYKEKALLLFKPNGGQASAFNMAFRVTKGDIILFLDADDYLYPYALQRIAEAFENNDIAKAHWPMRIVDANGEITGELTPESSLGEGDYREKAYETGPPFILSPPSSGNAWSRKFLESIMPLPEEKLRFGFSDVYMFDMVALYGKVKRIAEPLGAFRMHNNNHFQSKGWNEKFETELDIYSFVIDHLVVYAQRLGKNPDKNLWLEKSWFHRQKRLMNEIKKWVPENAILLLLDDNRLTLGKSLDTITLYRFLEKEGVYYGAPETNDHAMQELKVMQEKGCTHLAIAWPNFWWKEYYSRFYNFLNERYICRCSTADIILYDIK